MKQAHCLYRWNQKRVMSGCFTRLACTDCMWKRSNSSVVWTLRSPRCMRSFQNARLREVSAYHNQPSLPCARTYHLRCRTLKMWTPALVRPSRSRSHATYKPCMHQEMYWILLQLRENHRYRQYSDRMKLNFPSPFSLSCHSVGSIKR